MLDLVCSDIHAYPSSEPSVMAATRTLRIILKYITANPPLSVEESRVFDSISELCGALDRPELTCQTLHVLLSDCVPSDEVIRLAVKEMENIVASDVTDAMLEKR
jgi:hypothetical protein